MYDQQRYDCIGAAGEYPVKTPNIDKLAEDGAFFENAYTTNPVCAPARQALFSGRRPEAHGGLFNPDICFPVGSIPEDMPRWTKRFKENGYQTSYIGQWIPAPDKTPIDFGYEHYISRSEITQSISKKYNPEYTRGYFGEPSGIPLEESETHITARAAIDELDRLSGEENPWYLHIDLYAPHLPCRPSAPFDTMYPPECIKKWGGFDDNFENKPYIQRQQLVNWGVEDYTFEDYSKTVSMYYGMISQYDDALGRIINHLKQIGQYENTVIVFTADHGDMCGSHRMMDKHYIMYDDVLRVPLIIVHKGKIKPSRIKGYTQASIDLAPTLLDFADIKDVPEADNFHGESLYGCLYKDLPLLKDYAVSCYNGQQFGLYCQRSIRTDEYKYVLNSTDVDELYYIKNDKYELCNVIYENKHKQALEKLRTMLYMELERCKDPLLNWSKKQLTHGRKL